MSGTGKELVDGFGASVAEQVAQGSATVVLYGGAPDPGIYPTDPWPWMPPPDVTAPPIVPPTFTLTKPEGYTLTVTGPSGVVMTLALTTEEWAKVRAAILEAAR